MAETNKVPDAGDPGTVKRCADLLGGVEAYRKVDEGARQFESGAARRQPEWLKGKGLE